MPAPCLCADFLSSQSFGADGCLKNGQMAERHGLMRGELPWYFERLEQIRLFRNEAVFEPPKYSSSAAIQSVYILRLFAARELSL